MSESSKLRFRHSRPHSAPSSFTRKLTSSPIPSSGQMTVTLASVGRTDLNLSAATLPPPTMSTLRFFSCHASRREAPVWTIVDAKQEPGQTKGVKRASSQESIIQSKSSIDAIPLKRLEQVKTDVIEEMEDWQSASFLQAPSQTGSIDLLSGHVLLLAMLLLPV